MESLVIYLPNIIASLFTSLSLAFLGGLLASRSETLHAFVASQSASLGVTLSLAVFLLILGHTDILPIIPAVSAFFFALVSYLLAQKLCEHSRSKSTEILISLFLLIIAFNYLITAALPALEQHFSSAFIGDIATASAAQSYVLLLISALSGLFFISKMRVLLFQSFWISSSNTMTYPKTQVLFYLAAGLLIVESTRSFGFLYTASSLICLPLGASLSSHSFKTYLKRLIALSLVSTLLGFLASLYYQKVSTSASIVLFHILSAGVSVALKKRPKN